MPLIKLQERNEQGEEVGVVYVNSDQIVSIATGQVATEIHTADGRTVWVRDTPEHIVEFAKPNGA